MACGLAIAWPNTQAARAIAAAHGPTAPRLSALRLASHSPDSAAARSRRHRVREAQIFKMAAAQASPEHVQQLLALLEASLSPDAGRRQAAEAALNQAAAAPGFGLALVAVLLAAGGEVPLGLRQLAATVLKKLVREHWTEESPHFKGPPVGAEEREAIKERLPEGLGDESSKVRTAVAMAVAGIAKWDCPQAWPGLIPGLVQAITAKKNANLGERH